MRSMQTWDELLKRKAEVGVVIRKRLCYKIFNFLNAMWKHNINFIDAFSKPICVDWKSCKLKATLGLN